MAKNDKYDLPEELFEFALIPRYEEKIRHLAGMAEVEDWSYQNTASESEYPILSNYLCHTYKRIAEEKKVSFSKNDTHACFDTGLVTPNQESIYMLFTENKFPDHRCYWHFWKFARRGEHEMTLFYSLPEMAFYFDNPAKLVYDTSKELNVNVEHIIEDNKDRFPEPYSSMSNFQLQTFVKGVVDNAVNRVKRNYKIAIPQYYRNSVQLLLPLCLSDARKADLALVVEDYGNMYRAATCLTLDMAINNARLLAKPDRDWLQP